MTPKQVNKRRTCAIIIIVTNDGRVPIKLWKSRGNSVANGFVLLLRLRTIMIRRDLVTSRPLRGQHPLGGCVR